MYERTVVVPNAQGGHARPCHAICSAAEEFVSEVRLFTADRSASATSMMDLMILSFTRGSELTVVADGDDEKKAVERIVDLIESGFGEL